ncbi:mitogen-activated protein kinase kinase 9-like [Mercurialis annua]|uniref:mitogen-activated protein kinase kinase 9-like n=1 Tax=Mercurialis annua TaxID=3986 RepID=UPI00215F68E2|nr:mitogen-activated protein kinase kinase 9-like [Mercurialis annua]
MTKSETCLRVCSKILKPNNIIKPKRRTNLSISLQEVLKVESKFLPISSNKYGGVAQEDLEELCVLGRGNYGVVYKVRHRSTSEIYALKVIQEDIMMKSVTSNSNPSQEIEILTGSDSPFLTKCYGVFDRKVGEKAIIMEYMEAGTVESLLKNHGPFPEYVLGHIAYQVLNGLSYLHARHIAHLDIKPANLLVNKDMKVKISDFGISKIVDKNADGDFLGSQGTYAYMSPERSDSGTFGLGFPFAGDVWSLGVSLLELCVGHFPFFSADQKPNTVEIVMKVCYGELDEFLPEEASEEFLSFLRCCLEKDPCKRWSSSQLLTHPFICMDKDPIPCNLLDSLI